MCVVAIAWRTHPDWLLVAAGNRDEYHARASQPLAAWGNGSGIIAGRDLVSGGTWMGVSEAARFAVVTNIRDAAGPDTTLLSRGALVADWLGRGRLPEASKRFNPFNLIVTGPEGAEYVANRPESQCVKLASGIHGLSNAIANEHWPRMDRLERDLAEWLEAGSGDAALLFDLLRSEISPDRDAHPLFINSPVYGTRCSTVVLVNAAGDGRIIERRFDEHGGQIGQSEVGFRWHASEALAADRGNHETLSPVNPAPPLRKDKSMQQDDNQTLQATDDGNAGDSAPELVNREQEDEDAQAQTLTDDAIRGDAMAETESVPSGNAAGIMPEDAQDVVDHMNQMERSGRIDMDAFRGERNDDDEAGSLGQRETDDHVVRLSDEI